jgi:hypothetical protein
MIRNLAFVVCQSRVFDVRAAGAGLASAALGEPIGVAVGTGALREAASIMTGLCNNWQRDRFRTAPLRVSVPAAATYGCDVVIDS